MKRFRYELSLPLSLLLCVLGSGAITLVVLWTHPVSFLGMLRRMLGQPLVPLLNWLPILLLVLAFFFLLRNVFFSAALVGFLTAGLGIANRVKMQIRNEPLIPRDFGLLKEAMDAAGSYELRLPWGAIFLVLGLALLCLLLGLVFPTRVQESRQNYPRRGGQWGLRLGGFAGSLAALVCAVAFLYSSDGLYKSVSASVSNPYNLTVVCNELGLPYFFSYHFSTYQLNKPEGFSKTAAAAWETGGQPDQGVEVNVVFVMNEAFSDLTNAEMFTYGSENDPLQTYNSLRSSDNARSGHIVVPGFAGGTANTEFDVITGMQTNALGTNSAFRSFNRDLDSVLRIFADDGYHVSFLHPGDPWFYNRENVYQLLGARDALFVEDFANSVSKGRWVTDDTVAQNLISRFDQAVAAGEQVLDYAVTIQNHMSYTADKYGADYDYPPVETSLTLSESVGTLLKVYIEGLRDADAMLKTLTDHYAASGEPVVLVFFGDHLPYLGDERLGYRELGLPAGDESGTTGDAFAAYETPFLIWCNDEAAAQVDLDALDLPEDGVISASFLGAAVLELTGRGEVSPWFAFLNQLRRELPVIHNGLYRDSGGQTLTEPPAAVKEKLDQWAEWTYYKIKYKKVA